MTVRGVVWAVLAVVSAALMPLCGCAPPERLRSPRRYDAGLVLILPGIEGRSLLNYNLALGLDEGGVRSAIEIWDWTTGLPGALVLNLVAYQRNQHEAERIARRIARYQVDHPGRPVHLIGHSGGGGVAVLALERLPDDVQVTQALLLAPCIAPEYDLTAALKHTRLGIVNFYSPRDVVLLKVGTSLFGRIDRTYGPAAGAVGFRLPATVPEATSRLYREKLRQVRWRPQLRRFGADGSHVGWTSRKFAREYLAELIRPREDAAAVRMTND